MKLNKFLQKRTWCPVPPGYIDIILQCSRSIQANDRFFNNNKSHCWSIIEKKNTNENKIDL